jgi:inward rectifier potassium channel
MAKDIIDKFEDLGLGSKATAGSFRALNKDGSFNVSKSNVPLGESLNVFHSLISMSWAKFIGLIILAYLFVNLLFACVYVLVGVENLTAVRGSSGLSDFLEAFFFSAQTITTLGYGRVAPVGELANTVAAIESMLGLLSFALATGMLYGRFSKPSAKMKYSSCAVIAPYQDINGFMFRVVNPQDNQLLEVEVNVTVSMRREDSDLRDFHFLTLERSHIVFFPSIWTVVHPIDEKSPLHGMDEEELIHKDAEFIVMIKAFDESFSQTVYSRSSYKANEIRWGEKFAYIINHDKGGIDVDVGRIDDTVKMELN